MQRLQGSETVKIKVKKNTFKAVIKISDYEIGKLQLNKETLVKLVEDVCKVAEKENVEKNMEVMDNV